jgi:hypothetical protein
MSWLDGIVPIALFLFGPTLMLGSAVGTGVLLIRRRGSWPVLISKIFGLYLIGILGLVMIFPLLNWLGNQ